MKKLFVNILLVAGLTCALSAQTYNITTIAGSPVTGVGDGGSAFLAPLVAPTNTVVDAAGNVYIADPGILVTTASCGNGACTTTGSGLQTITATVGVGRIRKIDGTTGVITTLTTAIAEVRGMVLDSAGAFLYVADTGGNRIRKVDTTTGANTTVAGTGTAGFSGDGRAATSARIRGPRAVILDKSGNIIFSDTLNNRVRKVDAKTGIITTIAGKGPNNSTQSASSGNVTANPAGDGGLAVLAQLANPEGLALDASGNLYISDTNNNRIRVVSTSGVITTFAGLGTPGSTDGVSLGAAQFNSPRGIAFDAAGLLYVSDLNNNRVRQINASQNLVRTVAGGGANSNDNQQAASSTLANPSSVAFDSTGNMLISDQANAKVRKVDTTGLISTVAGVNKGGGDNGPAQLASLSSPRGVAVGADGSVYVSDSGNNKVRKIDTTGTITRFLGLSTGAGNGASAALGGANGPAPATSFGVSAPGCVVVDASNNVFVADRVNGKIREVTAAGSAFTVVNNGGSGYNGDGLAGPGTAVLNTSSGVPGASGTTNFNGPNCVAVDALGNGYIADTSNNVIRAVSAAGIISTVVGYQTVNGCPPAALAAGCIPVVPANGIPSIVGVAGVEGDGGSPATSAQLNAPQGLGIDATGTQLCIADTQNHIVRQVDLLKNTITTLAGIASDGGSDANLPIVGWQSRLNLPAGCAFDTAGNVFIADTSNNRVMRVDGKTGIMSLIAGGGTNFTSDGKAATTAQLFQPVGITVDVSGNVYFTDRYGMVKKLTPQ